MLNGDEDDEDFDDDFDDDCDDDFDDDDVHDALIQSVPWRTMNHHNAMFMFVSEYFGK